MDGRTSGDICLKQGRFCKQGLQNKKSAKGMTENRLPFHINREFLFDLRL